MRGILLTMTLFFKRLVSVVHGLKWIPAFLVYYAVFSRLLAVRRRLGCGGYTEVN